GRRRGDSYVDAIHDRIRALGVAARFAWPGFVADPARVMSEIDILVQPSDQESFGRVVVEAMAASLPVVAARGGGAEEIVDHGRPGLPAAPDDPAALASEIVRLTRDAAQRHALGAAGRRRAETHYSLEAHTRNILQVYRSAVEHPRLARSSRRDSLT